MEVKHSYKTCFHFDFSNISTDQMLYSEKDLEKSMDKIETVNFHQVSEYLCMLVD